MAAAKAPVPGIENASLAKKKESKGKKYGNAKTTTFAQKWYQETSLYGTAMIVAEEHLYVAGPRQFDEDKTGTYLDSSPVSTSAPPTARGADKFRGTKGLPLMGGR